MSRTTTKINNKDYPRSKKTQRTKLPKGIKSDKKDFGFTYGVHSKFDTSGKKKYPVKGVDYIKDGYGNGTKKENRVKNYKKEIE